MRFPAIPAAAIAVLLLSPAAARAEVRLTIAGGRVSLSASNATVGQILAEWARVGQTRIVNADRLPAAPVTIELADVPEAQALDVVLRTVSGYLAAPRATDVPTASHFDRIYLLPTSVAAAARATPAPAQGQPPAFQPPPAAPDDQDTADEAPPARALAPPARGPAFNSFPQPRPEVEAPKEAAPAPPVVYQPSNVPAGAAAPGMPVPGTPQPAQPPGR